MNFVEKLTTEQQIEATGAHRDWTDGSEQESVARKKNTQEKVHEEHRYSGIGGSGSKATSNENRKGVGKSE